MKRKTKDLTTQEILSLVFYDCESGNFYWSNTIESKGAGKGKRGHIKGDVASRKAANGYLGVTINSVPVLCHRLAWFLTYGKWPDGDIDHKNGVRTDNRISNLRDVPRSINMQNLRSSHSDTESRLLGAYLDKRRGYWYSKIHKDGKTTDLGSFKTAQEAHQAYLDAKRRIHEGCTI